MAPFTPAAPPSLGLRVRGCGAEGGKELWPPSSLGVLWPGCAAGLSLLLGAAASSGQSLDGCMLRISKD